jgi:hypothetical protein
LYAAIIRTFPFKANVHVNYQETVLPMHDGLPKFKDIPKEMGGTGEMIEDVYQETVLHPTGETLADVV